MTVTKCEENNSQLLSDWRQEVKVLLYVLFKMEHLRRQ